jgi:lysophospholipase L1-like esterase
MQRPGLMRIVRAGIVVLAATVVAIILAELALRLLKFAPAGGVHTVDAAAFARVPGIFEPGQHVIDRQNPNLPHQVTIDSLGYRGQPFPRAKPRNEVRVLFIGDSFTYGDFVNDSETVPSLVEVELRRSCQGVRAINAGIGGSTIVDQIEMVTRALPLAPDIVVLSFSENDVSDLAEEPLWQRLARNREAKSKFPFSLIYALTRETALWNLALRIRAVQFARRQTGTADDSAGAAPVAAGATTDSVLRARYMAGLRRLRDTLHANAVPLVVAAVPSHHTVYGRWTDEQLQWIDGAASSLKLPFVSFMGVLRASGLSATEAYLLPHDGHTSARGNSVIAGALAPLLRSQPALLASCGAR